MKTVLLVVVIVAAVGAGLAWLIISEVRDERHQRATATYQEVGMLLDCQPVPIAWNDFPRSRVETTKGVFIIKGFVSALKGSRVRLSSDGYLFVQGNVDGHSLVDR